MTSPRPHKADSKSCLWPPGWGLFLWDDVTRAHGSVLDSSSRSPINIHFPNSYCSLLYFSFKEMLLDWGLRVQLLPYSYLRFPLGPWICFSVSPKWKCRNTWASWNASEAKEGCRRLLSPKSTKLAWESPPSLLTQPCLCLSFSYSRTRILWNAYIWTINATGCTFWGGTRGKKDTHKFLDNKVKKINYLGDNKGLVEFISMITVLDLYCVQLRLESQQPCTVWYTLWSGSFH